MILNAVGFAFIAFSNNYLLLIISFIIAAIGFGFFHPISFSLVTRIAKNNLGKAMGDFTAMGDIGRLFLTTILTFTIIYFGWKKIALSFGIIPLIIIFILILLRKKTKEKVIINKVNVNTRFIEIIKNNKFIYALLTNFFDNFASSSLFIFLPFLLIAKNIDPKTLGFFTSAFIIGNFLGKSILGRLSDKFKNTKVFIVAEFFMVFFIILLANSSSLYLIIFISIILGMLTKGTVPVRSTMISESNQKHGDYDKAFAVSTFISEIANTLSPIILGKIADLYGVVNSFNFAALIAFLAIIPAFLFQSAKE